MAAPIYNPVIPCIQPIPNGMYPGRMIRFQGSVPPGAQRFAINLQCGPNTDPRDDIALHLNFRFVEMCVVRNHLTAMAWGNEETSGGMPLTRGEAFEALILCEPNSLKIALNGMHFCEFPHRLPYQRISHLTVDGDVMMQFIGFEGAQAPPPQNQMYMQQQPAYGTYGAPPPAYGAPGYGAPQGFGGQPVQGYDQTATYAQQPQQRRGMGAGAAAGLGVGALAAGGLAGYAIAGGFGSNSPDREVGRTPGSQPYPGQDTQNPIPGQEPPVSVYPSVPQPGQEVPTTNYPGQEMPTSNYPGQPYPGQEMPASNYPGQPYPGQEMPASNYPGQPYPGQEMPASNYPGQPYPGQEMPASNYPGQPYPGQEMPTTNYPDEMPDEQYHAPDYDDGGDYDD